MATSLVFLTPLAALLTVGVLVPLAALHLVSRRARRVRDRLDLAEPPRRRFLVTLTAVLVAGTFLGVAAAQPVVERTRTQRTRTDAEAFVVLDISRSMLAQRGTGSPRRIDRAKTAASALRSSLVDVPVGVASFTDRMLPHLFPSVDEQVFEATVDRSVGIEQPPPRSSLVTSATTLDALATIRTLRYFSPKAPKRLLLVLTDGETQPVAGARLAALFRQSPAIETVFVQFWDSAERVYTGGAPESYRPNPHARALLDGIAKSFGASVYDEGDLFAAAGRAQELLGEGPTVVRGELDGRVPLAPYLAVAALVPIGFLLRRRDR